MIFVLANSSSRGRGRGRGDPALLAQFAHDLRDVDGSSHLGLLLLLHLPQDDGTQTGPPVPGILLQLGLTGEADGGRRRRSYEGQTVECPEIRSTHLKQCSSGQTAFLSISLNTEDFMYRPYESCAHSGGEWVVVGGGSVRLRGGSAPLPSCLLHD